MTKTTHRCAATRKHPEVNPEEVQNDEAIASNVRVQILLLFEFGFGDLLLKPNSLLATL